MFEVDQFSLTYNHPEQYAKPFPTFDEALAYALEQSVDSDSIFVISDEHEKRLAFVANCTIFYPES